MTTQADASGFIPVKLDTNLITDTSRTRSPTVINSFFQEGFEERIYLKTDKFEYERGRPQPGLVVIINQENFLNKKPRKGTRRDVNEIINCFQRLGYNIEKENIIEDVTTDDLKQIIKRIASRDLSDYNCLILFYLSHGDEYNLLSTIDGSIDAHEIWKEFDNNKHLKNKPKMFVFQACKGKGISTTGNISPPSPTTVTIPKETALIPFKTLQQDYLYPDLLVVYSTVEGSISLRHTEQGSWFIQELCKNFSVYAKRDDVISMILRASKCVAYNYYHLEEKIPIKQMPIFVSTLKKKFYLNTSKDRDFILNVVETCHGILKDLKEIKEMKKVEEKYK